jgi:predicted DCC family thiol-disulfide oxidoreductase YuxK
MTVGGAQHGAQGREILLVYDQECPVCDAYCRSLHIRESAGELRLINAREDTAFMADLTRLRLDIDQGMVVVVGGTLHYGADAIHALARLSGASGVFGRINYWLFTSQSRSQHLYPLFRSARNLLLKALGKTKINNLQLPDNGRF